jgi:putative endonuclease
MGSPAAATERLRRLSAFVYLLRCADGSLYCGWSTDPERRWRQHQAGAASRYTRARLPVELVWTERHRTRADAMRRELEIKRLPAVEKRALIERGPPSSPGIRGPRR